MTEWPRFQSRPIHQPYPEATLMTIQKTLPTPHCWCDISVYSSLLTASLPSSLMWLTYLSTNCPYFNSPAYLTLIISFPNLFLFSILFPSPSESILTNSLINIGSTPYISLSITTLGDPPKVPNFPFKLRIHLKDDAVLFFSSFFTTGAHPHAKFWRGCTCTTLCSSTSTNPSTHPE